MASFTFLFSLSIIVVLMVFVFNKKYHFWIGLILCLYYLYRYVSLVFSNPGFGFEKSAQVQEQIGKNYPHRFCNTCDIFVGRGTRHCTMCDVCIRDYDHHCIFIGKCVGGGNIWQFREFLSLIFGILVYGLLLAILNIPKSHQNLQHQKTF